MMKIIVIHSNFPFLCLYSESAVGIQEDRKKVPWSDKETIILLELWGDQQVEHINAMDIQHLNCDLLYYTFKLPDIQTELLFCFTSTNQPL